MEFDFTPLMEMTVAEALKTLGGGNAFMFYDSSTSASWCLNFYLNSFNVHGLRNPDIKIGFVRDEVTDFSVYEYNRTRRASDLLVRHIDGPRNSTHLPIDFSSGTKIKDLYVKVVCKKAQETAEMYGY